MPGGRRPTARTPASAHPALSGEFTRPNASDCWKSPRFVAIWQTVRRLSRY